MGWPGTRGLSVFISDIRNCQNKEQERLRVDKELGNIRTRFKNEKVRLGFLFFLSASLLTSIATSCCCFFHHFSRILLLEFDFYFVTHEMFFVIVTKSKLYYKQSYFSHYRMNLVILSIYPSFYIKSDFEK